MYEDNTHALVPNGLGGSDTVEAVWVTIKDFHSTTGAFFRKMKSQGQNRDILQICALFLLYFLKSYAPKGHLIKVKIDKSSVFFNTQSLFFCYCLRQRQCGGVYRWTGVPQKPKNVTWLGFRRSSYWLNVWLFPRAPEGLCYRRRLKWSRCQLTVHHRNWNLLAANPTQSKTIYLSHKLWGSNLTSMTQ